MPPKGKPSSGVLSQLWSQTDLAAFVQCDPRTIRDLTTQGIIPRDSRTRRYPASQAVCAYIAWREGRAQYRGDEALDYNVERARLTKAQADRAELRRDREAGRLLDRDETTVAVEHVFVQVRQHIIGRSSSLPALLVGLDEREIAEAISKADRPMLRLLAHPELEFAADFSDPELDVLDSDTGPEPGAAPGHAPEGAPRPGATG